MDSEENIQQREQQQNRLLLPEPVAGDGSWFVAVSIKNIFFIYNS